MINFDLEWGQLLLILFKILGAFILSMPIAWEREQSARSIGLRTFPLVAMASCAYVLIAIRVVGSTSDAQARIIQGLMSGIGFIGGGAILKGDGSVRGTATAASVWTTGAIGASVAYELYEVAIIISIINFLVLRILTPIKLWLADNDSSASG